jgi:hypothetical protein
MKRFFLLILAVALAAGSWSSASAQKSTGEQRVTFGAQCRFGDGRKASLIAASQGNHFMMFRQVDGGSEMVRFEIAKDGALIFEPDAGNQQKIAAWRDAFADLKKLPLLTIKAEEIRAFQAATDVPACGHPSFDWRTR